LYCNDGVPGDDGGPPRGQPRDPGGGVLGRGGALRSLDGALEVLRRCDGPLAEQVGLVARCVDAVAASAGKEQLVSSLTHLETCDCHAAAARCREDWWVEAGFTVSVKRKNFGTQRKTGNFRNSRLKSNRFIF
jgi:hypothetical protein